MKLSELVKFYCEVCNKACNGYIDYVDRCWELRLLRKKKYEKLTPEETEVRLLMELGDIYEEI